MWGRTLLVRVSVGEDMTGEGEDMTGEWECGGGHDW